MIRLNTQFDMHTIQDLIGEHLYNIGNPGTDSWIASDRKRQLYMLKCWLEDEYRLLTNICRRRVMGSGTSMEKTHTKVTCTTCGHTVQANCAWRQGRCPHRSCWLDRQLAKSNTGVLNTIFYFFRKLK